MNKFRFELEKLLITESIEDKGILKACWMSGSPGSGKDYVLNRIKSGQIEPRVVNTDKFTEFIAKKLNIDLKPDSNFWKNYGDKTKKLTKDQLSLYINSLLPLWIDGTSSNPSSAFRRVGILKSIGYDTAMVWINTDLEVAKERNKKREKMVPEDFLIKVHNQISKLKDYYRSEFNNFYEVNNNEGELNNDAILKAFRKVNNFFNSPVENPIGKELIKKMRKNGHKYLIDTDEYSMKVIKKYVSNWYKT